MVEIMSAKEARKLVNRPPASLVEEQLMQVELQIIGACLRGCTGVWIRSDIFKETSNILHSIGYVVEERIVDGGEIYYVSWN